MSVVLTVATVIGVVCFITALLDMGMNGSAYAGWAPWGLGIALVCFVLVWLFGQPAVY